MKEKKRSRSPSAESKQAKKLAEQPSVEEKVAESFAGPPAPSEWNLTLHNDGKESAATEVEPALGTLNALARLVEGTSECAAVTFIDNTLYFATNATFDDNWEAKKQNIKEPKNKKQSSSDDGNFGQIQRVKLPSSEKLKEDSVSLITAVMNYLQDERANQSSIRRDLFKQLCRRRLKSEKSREPKFLLDDQNFDKITDELISDHHAWEYESVKKLAGLFRISPHGSPDLVASIIRAYRLLSRVAHDFKKMERLFEREKHLKKINIKIIEQDREKVHAELRVIGYWIENALNLTAGEDSRFKSIVLDGKIKISVLNLGISKLCCAHCERVIKAVNKTLMEIDQAGEGCISHSPDEGFKETELTEQIQYSGHHGLTFKSEMPLFMDVIITSNRGDKKHYNELYKKFLEQYVSLEKEGYPLKNTEHLYYHGMQAQQSPSSQGSPNVNISLDGATDAELVDELLRRSRAFINSEQEAFLVELKESFSRQKRIIEQQDIVGDIFNSESESDLPEEGTSKLANRNS